MGANGRLGSPGPGPHAHIVINRRRAHSEVDAHIGEPPLRSREERLVREARTAHADLSFCIGQRDDPLDVCFPVVWTSSLIFYQWERGSASTCMIGMLCTGLCTGASVQSN